MQKLLKIVHLGTLYKLYIHHDNEHTKIILPDDDAPLEAYPFLPLTKSYSCFDTCDHEVAIDNCARELIDLQALVHNKAIAIDIRSKYYKELECIKDMHINPLLGKKLAFEVTNSNSFDLAEKKLVTRIVDDSMKTFKQAKENVIKALFYDGKRVFSVGLFDQFLMASNIIYVGKDKNDH